MPHDLSASVRQMASQGSHGPSNASTLQVFFTRSTSIHLHEVTGFADRRDSQTSRLLGICCWRSLGQADCQDGNRNNHVSRGCLGNPKTGDYYENARWWFQHCGDNSKFIRRQLATAQQSFQDMMSALQSGDLGAALQSFKSLAGNSNIQGDSPLPKSGKR
jgi:hypothetical protein